MMFQYKCLNPISPCGTSLFTEEYKQVEELQKADAVLVRSAAMHDMQDVPNLLAVARAGAGVNNIPIAYYSEKGIVVFHARSQCKWCKRDGYRRNVISIP